MTETEFNSRVALTRLRGRALDAARLVLVDGQSRHAAARQLGITASAVSRAVSKITRVEICRCCRQAIRKAI